MARSRRQSKPQVTRLQCSRCDYLVEADDADALHAVMMAHDAEGHPERYAGKTIVEVQELRAGAAAEIRRSLSDGRTT